MRALLLACGVTAAPALALVAPSPSGQAPQFPSTVEQVLVDAVVLDCDGAPVGGLTRDDFVLKEDRAAQSIVSFEAVDVAPGPARDALEPLPSVTANPAAGGRTPGRTFLVVFDDTRLSAGQGEAAKRALRDFLRTRVGDADNLLLVTTGGSTWWGARLADGRDDVEALIDGLKGRFSRELFPDQMSDAEAYRIVVQRDARTFEHVLRRLQRMEPGDFVRTREVTGLLDGTECEPRGGPGAPDMSPGLVCEGARDTYQRAVVRLRDTLQVLERALSALFGVRGREAAVLVSPGFYHDTEIDEFRRVVVASRRSNTPVYFLNASGLPDMPPEMTAAVGQPIDPADVALALEDGWTRRRGPTSWPATRAASSSGTRATSRRA